MDYFQTKTNPNAFAIDHGQTIRYPSNVLFAVNSADRDTALTQSRSAASSSPFNFTINKRENMLAGSFTRVGLTEFVMPYNIPNVNNATNKFIVTTTNAQTGSTIQQTLVSTFTTGQQGALDVGFFSGNALATRLQANMTTPSTLTSANVSTANTAYFSSMSSMTVNYGSDGYFQIATNNPSTLVSIAPYDNPTYPNAKTLFDIMNFTTGTTAGQTSTAVSTAGISTTLFCTPPSTIVNSGIASLRPTDFIDIQCDQLTYSQEVRDSMSQPVSRDILARIYLQSETTGTLLPNPQYQTGVLVGTPNTTISTLTLTNSVGNNNSTQSTPGLRTYQVYPQIVGTTPFTIYRQFQTPKYIKWGGQQNVPGYFKVQLYDDRGNLLSTDCNQNFPQFNDNNQPDWQMSCLASEN